MHARRRHVEIYRCGAARAIVFTAGEHVVLYHAVS
jgi:hypothetical protein